MQASEQDLNMDGKMDIIDIKATARGVGNVHSVKALMVGRCRLTLSNPR